MFIRPLCCKNMFSICQISMHSLSPLIQRLTILNDSQRLRKFVAVPTEKIEFMYSTEVPNELFTYIADSTTDTIHSFTEVQCVKPRHNILWFTESVCENAVKVRKAFKRSDKHQRMRIRPSNKACPVHQEI